MGPLTGDAPTLAPNLDAFAADVPGLYSAFMQAPQAFQGLTLMMTSSHPNTRSERPELQTIRGTVETPPEVLTGEGLGEVGIVTSG